MKSVKILPQTILFNGNLAQPQKYPPSKYLGYTVYGGMYAYSILPAILKLYI